MSFSVGIVGLPNVGKSTLFKLLTKKEVEIASYPFTTIKPNIGLVPVPDQRLKKIAEIVKPEKVTPTLIEFIDIAGLVKGAHKGEGLGNQFLAEIRNCDAILMVVRAFQDQRVENVLGKVNPQEEVEIVKTELLMKDLETLEKTLKKLEKEVKSKDKIILKRFSLLEKIKNFVGQGKIISQIDLTPEEKEEIKEYQFLTQKPILYLLNINSQAPSFDFSFPYLALNLKEEEEILELSEREREELGFHSGLDQLISNCYNILDLITFYTVAGGKETRAWTLKNGETIYQAAGILHSDFQKKFIRAEVIDWQKLIEAGGWLRARELGWIRIVGRDYLVKDGEIIEFKI